MTKKDDKPNIYQRINAVMAEIDYIHKGGKNDHYKYKFVSHDAVIGALHAQLVKHGITMIPNMDEIHQDGNRTSVKMTIDFVNIDEPTDRISVSYWGYGIDQQDKGVGKAVSYAVKYCLLKVFCLETGDDIERSNIDHEPQKITEAQAEEIKLKLTERPDLLDIVINAVPSKDLKNMNADRYPAAIRWIDAELGKIAKTK